MASDFIRPAEVVPYMAARLCVRRDMAAAFWEARRVRPVYLLGRTRYRRSDIDALITKIAEQYASEEVE